MNKIIVDFEELYRLDEWYKKREFFFPKHFNFPFKDICIVINKIPIFNCADDMQISSTWKFYINEVKSQITCYSYGEHKGKTHNFGKFVFQYNPENITETKIIKNKISAQNKTKLSDSELYSLIWCFIRIMTFILFANNNAYDELFKIRNEILERPTSNLTLNTSTQTAKPLIATQPNNQSATYILKSFNDGLSLVKQGSHNSPQGQFGVRGHYRHYKNGKTIWIASYTKGTGKKQTSKNYKLGL